MSERFEKIRRPLLVSGSVATGILLILLLVRMGRINLGLTMQQIKHAEPKALVTLLVLNFLLVYLSSEKWRSVDVALRGASDSVPSRISSFAITSIGMVIGLAIPVQVGMSTVRTFGVYFHGKALRRGTGGTLVEQGFDLIVVFFLLVASGVTWILGRGRLTWVLWACTMIALALFVARPTLSIARRLSGWLCERLRRRGRFGKFQSWLLELRESSVLDHSLSRRLILLSTARFAVIVLMAGQTAEAVRAPIQVWQLAAAIPFVVIACLIAITPGGLGVNELTYAAALHVFGVPFAMAAQWALANRVLGAASAVLVAAVAALVAGAKKMVTPACVLNSRPSN